MFRWGRIGGGIWKREVFIKERKILEVYDESSKVLQHFSLLNILCSSYLRDFEGFCKHLNNGKGNTLLTIYPSPFHYLSFSLIGFLSLILLTSICVVRGSIFCQKTFVIKKKKKLICLSKNKEFICPYMLCDYRNST